MKERFGLTRRKFIIFGGISAVTIGLPLAVDYANREALLGFSGEVEQTKTYLAKLRKEVKGAFGILPKEYFPQIADLAIAFFSRQMGYDRRRFEGKITLLDSGSYFEKIKEFMECGNEATVIDDPKNIPMFTEFSGDKIYVNAQFKNYNQVHETFGTFLHELHHAAPPPRWDEEKKAYTKGLIVLKKGSSLATSGKECLLGYEGGEEEEMVVQDSTKRLLALVAFSSYQAPSVYMEAYRRNVLDSLYGGDHRELLAYQQQSRPADFHRSIGAKLGEIDNKKQVERGVVFMRSLLEKRNS